MAACAALVNSAAGVISTWIACTFPRHDCLLLCRWQPELVFTAHQCWLWDVFVQEVWCEWGTLHMRMIIAIYCYQPSYFFLFLFHLTFLVYIFPSPVMSCGMPIPPINGSIVGQDFSLGARATYQCNPGFRLSGPITTSVICQEFGRWSPIEAQPRCIREYLYLYLYV